MLSGVRRVAQRRVLRWGIGEQEAAATRRSSRTQLVHSLGYRRALVFQRYRVAVAVDRAKRLVQLNVGTLGQPLDDAGLDAMLEHLPVAALQRNAPPVGDEINEGRKDHHADAPDPRCR